MVCCKKINLNVFVYLLTLAENHTTPQFYETPLFYIGVARVSYLSL